MPDLKQVLYDEIRRLARKELKSALPLLLKQVSEQKKQISELKKQVAFLQKSLPAVVEVPAEDNAVAEENTKLRLNAAGIVRLRSKLKISQAELAKLIGVSGHTVSLWEIGKVSPRANAKAAICALRTIGKKELRKRLEADRAETD